MSDDSPNPSEYIVDAGQEEERIKTQQQASSFSYTSPLMIFVYVVIVFILIYVFMGDSVVGWIKGTNPKESGAVMTAPNKLTGTYSMGPSTYNTGGMSNLKENVNDLESNFAEQIRTYQTVY